MDNKETSKLANKRCTKCNNDSVGRGKKPKIQKSRERKTKKTRDCPGLVCVCLFAASTEYSCTLDMHSKSTRERELSQQLTLLLLLFVLQLYIKQQR